MDLVPAEAICVGHWLCAALTMLYLVVLNNVVDRQSARLAAA